MFGGDRQLDGISGIFGRNDTVSRVFVGLGGGEVRISFPGVW